MNTIFAVMGIGPNDLAIPLVMFPTKEEAEKFVCRFPTTDGGAYLSDDFIEIEGDYADEDDDNGQSELGRSLYGALFKNGEYYPGCGSLNYLKVEEVEFGKPMVGWDLD